MKFILSRVPFISKSNSENALKSVDFWQSYRQKK